MPTVDFDKIPEKHQEVMRSLVEHDRLVVMPKAGCDAHAKMVHHFLLKMLYRDTRWTVPLHHAWYMPHLVKLPDSDTLKIIEIEADEIVDSDCFGSPQPVYLGDKQYLVTREDGTTFIMKVS
jgi:hypothetical protein